MLKVLKLISCTVFLFAINFSCAVPQTSEAGDYLTSAREFELCAEWEQAGLMLDQWARLNPVDDSWQQRRLRCADGAGDRQTSMRIRRQLLALDAGDLALRIDLADDLQALGFGLEAISMLEESAAIERDAATGASLARRALAEICIREKEIATAAGLFEELAVEASPTLQPGLALTASSLWEELGEIEAALRCVEMAVDPAQMEERERQALARLKSFSQGTAENVAEAVALLKHHPDADSRLTGIVYLARDRFPGDLDVFIDALYDVDLRIVRVALNQIGLRGSASDADFARDFLDHPNIEVRISACGCIERGGDVDQAWAILPLLIPEDRALFRAARRCLQSICGETILYELDPNLEQRTAIAAGWQLWCEENLSP